ncbi:sensor histidine kinase [Companilactobacillus jidongensis]|uniref:sensor histidine kinase n=1 Tax=Companilactobacillus jidongensis TaxID=2486006 RepID=UPI000F782FEE|nr:sensor histidine kinase [Companilactobacillus jidongensis]
MKKFIKTFLKHQYNLHQIMYLYTRILMATVTVVALILLGVAVSNIKFQSNQSLLIGLYNSADTMGDQQAEVNKFARDLSDNPSRVANYRDFFAMNSEDYLSKSQEEFSGQTFYYLPTVMYDFFDQNGSFQKITLNENSSKDSMVVTPKDIGGVRIKANKVRAEGLYYTVPLVDKTSLTNFGSVVVNVSPQRITQRFDKLSFNKSLQFIVLSDTGQIQYGYHLDERLKSRKLKNYWLGQSAQFISKDLRQNYFIKGLEMPGNRYIYTLIPKQNVYLKMFIWSAIIIVLAITIELFLKWSFRWVFKYYNKELLWMTDSMTAISNGEINARLHVPRQAGEIRTLAEGINTMLDAIDKYVLQIYQLKLAQKDANLNALQSQINPHFLYNTLEYIRMYALNEGEEELAEVVFNFGSLMRNNISQETNVPLEQEFDFAEKYSYLYQMRYPDQVSYQYSIADEVKNVVVPKFIIQPLVENYFKYGLDLTKIDNAIHVSAIREDDRCVIKVEDNGKGMSDTDIKQLKDHLDSDIDTLMKNSKSVGIANIQARMQIKFNREFDLDIYRNKYQGITIQMSFKLR